MGDLRNMLDFAMTRATLLKPFAEFHREGHVLSTFECDGPLPAQAVPGDQARRHVVVQ